MRSTCWIVWSATTYMVWRSPRIRLLSVNPPRVENDWPPNSSKKSRHGMSITSGDELNSSTGWFLLFFFFFFFLFFIKHRGPGILGLVGRFLFIIWNRALLILYAPCIVPYSILFLCLMLSRSFVSHPEKIEIFYVPFSKVGYTSFKKPCSLLDSRLQSLGEAGRFDRKAARKDQEARRGTFSPLPSSRTKALTIFRRDVCFQSLSQESGW